METYFKEFINSVVFMNRFSKITLAIITDLCLCLICTWLAFIIRLESLNFTDYYDFNSAAIFTIIAIPIFWLFGIYRTIFRYAGLSILSTISISIFVYGFLYFVIIGIIVIPGVPRSIGLIQPLLLFFMIVASRLSVKFILTGTFNRLNYSLNKKNVLIYGAGEAGRQLLTSLENNLEYKVVGFLDDDKFLHKQVLLGQKIYNPIKLQKLIESQGVQMVLIAIPSISKIKKSEIIESLNKYKLAVKTLPHLNDIIDEKVSVSDIKDFLIEDLLDRDPVKANQQLLSQKINSKTTLITGAGGTIGAELSRQILKLNPKKLILFELNEYALFKIYEELSELYKNLEIIPLLGNILDQKKLEKVFNTFQVDNIFHAAAYKHVSLVESNICEGVRNNIIGTLTIVKAASNQKIKNLVFISSDKAVRPTNIMGVSKRFSELCLQVYKDKCPQTNFSIVRFGNVLASSGSVIPKFKQQIMEGGPVTLTHNDVTRYFMTVPEAAQLVIQAGAMGKNAEVFVLNMGKSIKIRDMIIKMINLSGQKLKDENNIDGNVEIKVTGLRPGEKLYEELLIGDNPEKTIHPKIQKINEPSISLDQFEKNINELKIQLDNQNSKEVKKILDREINFYNSNSKLVDYMYNEEKNLYEKLRKKDDKSNVIKFN